MLATLVIGLREGLEAALVVGIIAAFLQRNGRPLRAMWVGVAFAVLASVAVGIGLSLLETALPQAAQEGLETVIGAIAVVFVTGMLLWMRTHARTMKRELEAQADAAVHDGTAFALAAMAFLAVLKEGFETSVFLLATFRASSDTLLAAAGAVIGIAGAVAIGVGIFTGGVRLDLARFFRITSAFLVVVAAGLVLTAVRTAHEAGWLQAGQRPTVDLGWLAPAGSVQGALVTGVLGIPADPRLVEVVAWLAYLVPTALVVYWPQQHRPTGRAALAVRWSVAAALTAAAAVLLVAVPQVPAVANALALSGGGQVRLDGTVLTVHGGGVDERITLAAASTGGTLRGTATTTHPSTPSTLTLERLTAANGGRVPSGIDAVQDPGPYTAGWTVRSVVQVETTTDGHLLDASRTTRTVVTVSGGGLTTSRSYAVAGAGLPAQPRDWRVAPAATAAQEAALARAAAAAPDRALWAVAVPIGLLVAAALVAVRALVVARRGRPGTPSVIRPTRSPALAAD